MIKSILVIIKKTILSMPAMAVLILTLAIAIATATFTEDAYGTIAAKGLIYNAWWFEAILLLLCINLINNIFRHQLLQWNKGAILLFHLAFIVMIIGGAITRYSSFEGTLHIREGDSASTMISNNKYITISAKSDNDSVYSQKEVFLSEKTPNDFNTSFTINHKKVKVKSSHFYSAVEPEIITSPVGTPFINVYYLKNGLRSNQLIKLFQTNNIGELTIGLHATGKHNGNFILLNNQIHFVASDTSILAMMGQTTQQQLLPGDTTEVIPGQYIALKGYKIIPERFYPKGLVAFSPTQTSSNQSNSNQGVTLNMEINNTPYEIQIPGGNDITIPPIELNIDNTLFTISYNSIKKELPFKILLNDFIIERYPGSFSPSSFKSEVTLKDKNRADFDYAIYMNHVLEYGGYRFFQASYDTDEKGTILSVNQDYWGTLVSYIGYIMLTLGMILSLFTGKSAFRALWKRKGSALIILLLLSVGGVKAQDSIPSEDISNAFGKLWYLDNAGRVQPLNSFNREVLRKIHRTDSYNTFSANDVMLGMVCYPKYWHKQPIIAIKNQDISSHYNLSEKYASFKDFFDTDGTYILEEELTVALRTPPAKQSKYQRDLILIDERINVVNMVLKGVMLRLFPVPNTPTEAWTTFEISAENYSGMDSLFAVSSIPLIIESIRSGKDDQALTFINGLTSFQEKHASEIIPSNTKKEAELIYQKLDLFSNLAHFFNVLGLILVLLLLLKIFIQKTWINTPLNIAIGLYLIGVLLQTLGIILRWYISGYIPLSNSYESMVFIGWVTLLVGAFMGFKNKFGFAFGSVVGGFALLMAFITNLNPEITTLVPVLKSYWLNIHVTIMMLGYAFAGSSAFIGFITLLILALQNKNNKTRVSEQVNELWRINRLSLIMGLYFLTIGCFLGGVWANESWGTYWSWDPKESWALISILIYAFIAHIHHIKPLQGRAIFALITTIAFSSILMTYLGVNYFLGGMHSYAKGDGLDIPIWYIIPLIAIGITATIAFIKEKST